MELYWTLEKIEEAKTRLAMAESVEFPAMQAYELLALAESTLKLIEPGQATEADPYTSGDIGTPGTAEQHLIKKRDRDNA